MGFQLFRWISLKSTSHPNWRGISWRGVRIWLGGKENERINTGNHQNSNIQKDYTNLQRGEYAGISSGVLYYLNCNLRELVRQDWKGRCLASSGPRYKVLENFRECFKEKEDVWIFGGLNGNYFVAQELFVGPGIKYRKLTCHWIRVEIFVVD